MFEKDVIKKRILYSITDYKSIEGYLEKMALKGYMLSEIKGSKFIFKKSEQREVKYNVSLFYPDTIFDFPDEETRKDYRQICIDSGWTYCTSNTIFQIFYKAKDVETVPIHTDSMEEYKIIKSVMFKTEMISDAIIFLMLLSSILKLTNIKLYSLTSNIGLFANFISPVFLSYFFLDFLVDKVGWLITNNHRAKRKENLTYKSYRRFQIRGITMATILIAYIITLVLCMLSNKQMGGFIFIGFIPLILGVLSAILYKKFVKKSKRSRKKNITVFIIMLVIVWIVSVAFMFMILSSTFDYEDRYNQDIVNESSIVKLKDLRSDDPEVRTYYDEDSSFIIPSHISFSEYTKGEVENEEIDDISIEIYDCLNNWFAKYAYNLYLAEEQNRGKKHNIDVNKFPIDIERWNVDEGYYLRENTNIVLVKGSRFIVIETYNSKYIDNKFIDVIKEKLKLN